MNDGIYAITEIEFKEGYRKGNNRVFLNSYEVIDYYLNIFSLRIEKCSEYVLRGNIIPPDSEMRLFQIDSTPYSEHIFLNKILKWYIREHVLNDILLELFHINNIDVRVVNVEKHIEQYKRSLALAFDYDNRAFEDRYPFEFIVDHNGMSIGYRYYPFSNSSNKSREDDLFSQYNINAIHFIEWREDKEIPTKGEKTRWIQLKELFESYFTIEEYSYYVDSARKAILEANNKIGFLTIPNMNSRYVSKMRIDAVNDLVKKDYREMRFKKKTGELLGNNLCDSDYNTLNKQYLEKGFFRALLGTEGFAKCFMTSEYLYHVFNDVNSFDYTAVIAGYLKAVEQLLYYVVQCALLYCHGESGKIQLKKMKNYPKKIKKVWEWNSEARAHMIPFESKYEKYFDVTMGSLVRFLNDTAECWNLSENGKNEIHDCLLTFSQECRNEYFHKDNIYSIIEVERIRDNTYLCLYYILGGCRFSDLSRESNVSTLGIIDDSFDRLYLTLEKISKREFLLSTKDEETYNVLLIKRNKPRYNEDGLIESELLFYIVDENLSLEEKRNLMRRNRYSKGRIIVINRDNMPLRIATYVKGKYEQIEW